MENELDAVRWARREVRRLLDYTKWHLADNADMTLCGLPIRIAVATLFPEIDVPTRADCVHCRRKMGWKDRE